jgi:hypothetical protein
MKIATRQEYLECLDDLLGELTYEQSGLLSAVASSRLRALVRYRFILDAPANPDPAKRARVCDALEDVERALLALRGKLV